MNNLLIACLVLAVFLGIQAHRRTAPPRWNMEIVK